MSCSFVIKSQRWFISSFGNLQTTHMSFIPVLCSSVTLVRCFSLMRIILEPQQGEWKMRSVLFHIYQKSRSRFEPFYSNSAMQHTASPHRIQAVLNVLHVNLLPVSHESKCLSSCGTRPQDIYTNLYGPKAVHKYCNSKPNHILQKTFKVIVLTFFQ